MRTKQEIKNTITQEFIGNSTIIAKYNLTAGQTFAQQFSKVSFENIVFDIVAYSIYLLEALFGQHKKEVAESLYNQKSGRLPWYRAKALSFQFGFNLKTDSDEFDNAGATLADIEASKVIKYSAVVESGIAGLIVVKIATETGGEMSPVSDTVNTAVVNYFNEIRYAGTNVSVVNQLPDLLKLNLKIYRNPLVIDENGVNILTGATPVNDALEAYMKELPFNGELILAHLVDRLQAVEGVEIPHLIEASTSWAHAVTEVYGAYTVVNVKRLPESGYYKIENFDDIIYVV